MGREFLLPWVSPFLPRPCDLRSLSGISTTFAVLSRPEGQIAHVLLTRPPLIEVPKDFDPFDLHVLSTPPAFVLSQDQTLTYTVRASWLSCFVRSLASSLLFGFQRSSRSSPAHRSRGDKRYYTTRFDCAQQVFFDSDSWSAHAPAARRELRSLCAPRQAADRFPQQLGLTSVTLVDLT